MRCILQNIFALLIAALTGCNSGQMGKTVVLRNESGITKDGEFQFELLYGVKRGKENEEDAEALLLAVFFKTLEDGNFGKSEVGNGLYVSKVQRTWELAQGVLSAEIAWNRENDSVVVGDVQFDRMKGNIFLLVPQLPSTETKQILRLSHSIQPDALVEELRSLEKRSE